MRGEKVIGEIGHTVESVLIYELHLIKGFLSAIKLNITICDIL